MNRPIQKSILEGIIPIIGFFYWNWGLNFILFFFFLDWIAKEIVQHLGARRIEKTQGKSLAIWQKKGLLSSFLLFASICVWTIILLLREPNLSLFDQLKTFFLMKEMGIPQGYVLLPIVAIGVYMNFKMEFVKQSMDKKIIMVQWWKPQIFYNLAFLLSSAIGFCLMQVPALLTLIVLIATPIVQPFVIERFNVK